MRKIMTVLMTVSLLALGACAEVAEDGKKIDAKSSTPAADPSADEQAEEVEDPAPEPDPDGTYEDSCDYVLGDFSDNSSNGYAFIADVSMTNTGNIGTINVVKAVWFLGGGDKIVKTKKVKLPYGATRRAGFNVPATGDQIDRHQSLNGETCKVTVTMVNTFGEAQD